MFNYRLRLHNQLNFGKKLNIVNFNKFFFSTNVDSAVYQNIKVSNPSPNVGLVQLYRPKAKNALNSELIRELNLALKKFDSDDQVGCIVIGGDVNYFAAGADIKEMKDRSFPEVYTNKMLDNWNHITQIK